MKMYERKYMQMLFNIETFDRRYVGRSERICSETIKLEETCEITG